MNRILLAALALALSSQAAAQNLGVAAIVENEVRGAPPGAAAAPLTVGGGVVADEVVSSAADGRAQLLFLDETALTVGPASTVTLDSFVYDATRG
ncbi:MAG: porin, partial [Pseudomonadota bacterium]